MLTGCLVLVILAASRPCLAPPKPPASKPTGRWHVWVDWEPAFFLGGNDKHLWFGRHEGGCWRYDVKTRRVEAYTLINTWFNSFGRRLSLSPDGRLARLSSLGRHVDVWREGVGWRRLPDPPPLRFQSGLQRIAFDSRGRLLGIGPLYARRHPLLELTGRAWRTIGHLPPHSDFAPLGDGFFLSRYHEGPHWFLAKLGAEPRRYAPQGEVECLQPVLRAGGKLYGLSTPSCYGLARPQTLVEITPGKPVPRATGLRVGVDLTGKGFLTFTGTERIDRVRWRGHVTTPEGNRIPLDDVAAGGVRFLLRDANGHIWIGPRRWDGRRWQQVVPDNHLPRIRRPGATGVQLHLNPKTMTWSSQRRPGAPEDVAYYDTASKTGWTCEYREDLYHYRLLDFSADSPRELARYESKDRVRSFYHTPAGDWWWYRYPSSDAAIKLFRLSKGAKPRTYSSGPLRHGADHYLYVSPKGSLWLMNQAGWSRFDARKDAFVPGQPFDEYAVRLGEWTVACLGALDSQASRVFIKVWGRWEPMMNPFGGEPLCGTSQFVHGDRMIAFCPRIGIVEYDATHDRWARLHSRTINGYLNRARFDKHGRRFLAIGGYLLHYDSDPFAPPDAAERTRRRQFDLLLKRLDADQWRDRDAAMAELGKRLAELRPWLVTAMYPRLSPEVRTRVQLLLESRKVSVPVGPALFDRMRKLPIPHRGSGVFFPRRGARGDRETAHAQETSDEASTSNGLTQELADLGIDGIRFTVEPEDDLAPGMTVDRVYPGDLPLPLLYRLSLKDNRPPGTARRLVGRLPGRPEHRATFEPVEYKRQGSNLLLSYRRGKANASHGTVPASGYFVAKLPTDLTPGTYSMELRCLDEVDALPPMTGKFAVPAKPAKTPAAGPAPLILTEKDANRVVQAKLGQEIQVHLKDKIEYWRQDGRAGGFAGGLRRATNPNNAHQAQVR